MIKPKDGYAVVLFPDGSKAEVTLNDYTLMIAGKSTLSSIIDAIDEHAEIKLRRHPSGSPMVIIERHDGSQFCLVKTPEGIKVKDENSEHWAPL